MEREIKTYPVEILDASDCERLGFPIEYIGKSIQQLDVGGLGFGKYQILDRITTHAETSKKKA